MVDAVRQALVAGRDVLRSGGNALDTVQVAVRTMEDSSVLNAGRGSVLNHAGFAELDASIMDGADRSAGAVTAARSVRNPIDLARYVKDIGRHVILAGEGAEQFAKEHGFATVPADYFITPRRKKELAEAQARERKMVGRHDNTDLGFPKGTVGAVALDVNGDLAAATSTGGMTNKAVGRVSDSSIIGAGTYAENPICAVSTTGHGEYFIRTTAAAAVAARMKYLNEPLSVAAQAIIDDVTRLGGSGGLIAVDASGDIAMPYSSETMLRGFVASGARITVRE
jgi:beta-aspartyl-peptidase (threonine type)